MRWTKRFFTFLIFFVCAAFFFIITPSSRADLREQFWLVALWTLDQETIHDNDVDDAFGENVGTITGKPKVIQGFAGDALDFDGLADLVRMVNDIFFPSVSMEAIIKPTLGTRNPVYDKYNYGIQLLDSDQVGVWIRADTADTNKQWISAYTAFPKDGQWHHVVGVAKDTEFVKIYLDGKLMGTTPAPDPISIAYGAQVKPSIAYTQHMGGIWYEGGIDEVAVYEGALTDADVSALYTAAFALESAGKLATTWGMLKR